MAVSTNTNCVYRVAAYILDGLVNSIRLPASKLFLTTGTESMYKLIFAAILMMSSAVFAQEPGELPGPTSSDGGGSEDKTPLPPTSSDGGWEG